MRVVCEKILTATDAVPALSSPWLTVDKEYLVLEVIAAPMRRVLLRLEDDSGPGPSVYDARMFRTTSAAIPPSWIATLGADGSLRLGPESWLRDGFWEDYFEGDRTAIESFVKELATLVAHDKAACASSNDLDSRQTRVG
jgi:hypothetical protein